MKSNNFIIVVFSLACSASAVFAQNSPSAQKPIQPNAGPKVSEIILKNLAQARQKSEIPREQREQAYAKLLEGQRYIWMSQHTRSQAARMQNARLASQALQKAIELNPTLSEAYTALADLTRNTPPFDITAVDEAIILAEIAVKVQPNNFGGHQILAQLYTLKSNLNRGILDPIFTQKAIKEWQEIVRLDQRNAEAHAFLSEFYARTRKNDEQISALKNWLASAPPLRNGFYGQVFQTENLSPESASVKLGAALIRAGQTAQAVEILSQAVADEPSNTEVVELLLEALEMADAGTSAKAVQALQQALYSNPENPKLIAALAQIKARTEKPAPK
ncbi:MAG: hypothetical protein H0T08_03300 [Acidobacteria bacterium]|jgi:tetratricopeptide (TPR) repeat protein|nr:hypothetical protein [Acidobacteriota bacterium]